VLAGFWALEAVSALSLYLEMPEQVGRNQRLGEYCRNVFRWISRSWNGETPSIFELPLGFFQLQKLVLAPKCRFL
jgi:hypothetical protein